MASAAGHESAMSGELLTPGEVLSLVQFPQFLSRDERNAAVITLPRVRVENAVQLCESDGPVLRRRANGAAGPRLQIWEFVERPIAPCPVFRELRFRRRSP